MKALVVLSFLLIADSVFACRCAPRELAEYFASAQEVFMAKLVRTETFGEDQRRFHFERIGEPYKALPNASPSRPYLSSASSAGCGVEAEPGAVYVVFAEHDPESDVAWLTTCNGTRIHRAVDGSTFGFDDVPPRFVTSQLDAFAAIEALRRIDEPDPNDLGNQSLVGLLDVAAFSHAHEIPLWTAAGPEAEVAGTASGYEALAHRESGYEVDAAVVFAVVDGWYKVRRTDGGFAWLAPDAAGTYWPLDELLPNRLAYLTLDWNRWIWPGPGTGNPTRLSYDSGERPREQPVKILGSRRIGGSLWLEVEVLSSDPCEGEPDAVWIRGWTAAYGETGEPVAWYHSRGC